MTLVLNLDSWIYRQDPEPDAPEALLGTGTQRFRADAGKAQRTRGNINLYPAVYP